MPAAAHLLEPIEEENEETIEPSDDEFTEQYRKLNENCDRILTRIKQRKEQQNAKGV